MGPIPQGAGVGLVALGAGTGQMRQKEVSILEGPKWSKGLRMVSMGSSG